MKTLYILRHAKSSWDDTNLTDFERPLNRRGEKTAPFMGELMAQRNFNPELIVSSPAERAKQTAEMVKEAAGFESEIRFDERIYEATPFRLLEVVGAIDDRFGSAMIVGHNPGFEGLVRVLTGEVRSMPTAALAVVEADAGSWTEIAPENCRLKELIRPKEEMND